MYDILFSYAYVFGAPIFFIVWFPIFLIRKDLRKEMLFGGVIAAVLAATSEFVWVPYYWNPPFLFDLVHKVGFSLDDFIVWFFGGGIAAVLFEFVENKKEIKIKRDKKHHFFAFLGGMLIYAGTAFVYPIKPILGVIAVIMFICGIMAYCRKDLIKQMFLGGFLFMLVYVLLFQVFLFAFPKYIITFYNLKNFWPHLYFGLPIEEFVFSFCLGMLWSVLYEYALGYKTK